MQELIFGKDPTQRIVCVEPGNYDKCMLFIQGEDGRVIQKTVPQTHWIIYSENHRPDKFQVLEGNQHYKYLIEYDSLEKYNDVLKQSRARDMESFVCRDRQEAFMVKTGVTYYKGLKVKDVAVLSFDLEHTYGIGSKLDPKGRLLTISNTYRNHKGEITKKLFAFDEFESEGLMLTAWCEWVLKVDPSIIVGHNIFGHDFQILKFAAKKCGVKLRLGRNRAELNFDYRKSLKRKDGSQSYDFINVRAFGREIIDTFFLALNYDIQRNYENYKLKYIVNYEGLEKEGRVHYDASKIKENYLIPEEWQKIKEYAKDDADDSLALFDLMIDAYFYATQSIPRSLQYVNNSASGSQINGMMIRGYLQQGHSIAKASEKVSFPGAISFGWAGLHKNVLRFDVSSLYPSLIRQYRIFSKEKDPQEVLLKIIDYFTEERLKNKRIAKETGDKNYKALSEAQKIIINSMYGFMGAPKLNYNYPAGAAEVTRRGREILQRAILWATGSEYQWEEEQVEHATDEAEM